MALSTTMDKCGPMCRYAEDTILVLNAIYGPDAYDPSVADAALTWNPDAPLAGFRIAYVKTAFENAGRIGGAGRGGPGGGAAGAGAGGRGTAPTPEQQAAADAVKKMYDDVLATYTKLGAKLEAVDLPDLSLTNSLSFILDVEASASFDDVTRSGDINQIARPAVSNSSWPNTFRQARFVPAVEYIRAMRGRTLLQRTFDGFMSQYDALLEVGTGSITLSTTNLTGHPAMAVKCGVSMVSNNATPPVQIPTPRMLMLTGKLYEEGTLARIAMAFEQATEWKDRHPTLV
jgi:Asp-tRNA(Asn)/Glu-tRNA(Gln) amidotransferase A subunit family amidase